MKLIAHRLPSAALVAAFVLGLAGVAMATPESDAYRRAQDDMRKGDWAGARDEATGIGRDIVEWARLRDGNGDFADYVGFLAKHGDWPGLEYLRRRGEAAIPQGSDAAQILAYFGTQQPQTGTGTERLIEAYQAIGATGDAEAQAVLAWRSMPLGPTSEARIFTQYADLLKPHHEARLDSLLWDRDASAVERMLPRVSSGQQALARARLLLAQDKAGVDDAIAAVPEALRSHPGLVYERFAWRARRDRDDDAIALMLEASASAATLGQPEKWASRRARLSRILMRQAKGEAAYQLASSHRLTEGSAYADLEWLSGYIALTYLQDPVLALDHFNRFRLAVETPISLGRAGYWEGRALEAMGATSDARAAYSFGAQHQTSFYGLLSAQKAGLPMVPELTQSVSHPGWRRASFADSSVLQAAILFRDAGELPLASRFLNHLAEGLSAGELAQLGDLVLSWDEPYLAVRLGKMAAGRGVVLPALYYPLHPLAQAELPVDPALALSIARRESEFYVAARSGVGARGLMQLMPGTAQEMARKLDVTYSANALTSDASYNARLGSAYLAQLIEQFGDAPVLVAAGYNAGPSRPIAWIEEFGDPRAAGVDPVDWIEHVPFNETRNYIMRVAESLPVYRARLAGKSLPLDMERLLRGQ